MAKILNIRERVHQPFRDALCRTAGLFRGQLNQTTDLFIAQGRDEGFTNLKTSAVLPNDSSMIILAARVLQWFRKGEPRVIAIQVGIPWLNGDGDLWPNAIGQVAYGNAWPDYQDVYRLHWQCAEGLFWTLGAGDKNSLQSMPSMYFPMGGGLWGRLGGAGSLRIPGLEPIPDPMNHWNNGTPTHTSILRIARAITITPRQLIKASVTAVSYPDGGNGTTFGTSTAIGRNMLNPISNLNCVDGVEKVVALVLDGLLSRDVQ